MALIDLLVFALFIGSVIGVGLLKSRNTENRDTDTRDYFLAGRGLTWWLVGFSLIAANISTEQFVGMSGKAAGPLGMAIASYEWMAAVTLVVVAFLFLPAFLKSGIYTIPEFLEYRYNRFARTLMALSTLIILVGVPTASVIFAGAKVICVFFAGQTLFGLDLGNITVACWIIAVLAAIYVFAGGLKACAWADLIQGAALIVGGFIVAWLTLRALGQADPETLRGVQNGMDPAALAAEGPIGRLVELNRGALPDGKLHMIRPADDPEIPWTALLMGLWIPNFFYWGLNQYITQRTLGARSLDEGQRGIVFAAFLKLIIPFIVVIPGVLAFNLWSADLSREATIRNETMLSALQTREPSMMHPFDEDFAALHPEQARFVLHQNLRQIHPDRTPADLAQTDLTTANQRLIREGRQAGLPIGETLIGYDYDAAFPTILRNVLPRGVGLMGFVLAAIFGAVVSSLASMLNSASTIFTMDIYAGLHKTAQQTTLVRVGRLCTIVFVLIAALIAPSLGSPAFGGIFTFIQEFQGFISPGILAIFLFGRLIQRAPRIVGTVGLLLNPALYGILKWTMPQIDFLNRMAICFGAVLLVLALITLKWPLRTPVQLPVNPQMDLTTRKSTRRWGIVVVLITVALYIVFW